MKIRGLKLRMATLGVAATTLFAAQSELALGVQLHNGLISYWKLNEGTGSVANDTGPAGSVADNGVINNSPAWISGKFNAGLQFDGVSQQHVLVPQSSDMDVNTQGVTLSAWVKLDQLPSEIAGSFSGIYDSAPDNYALYLDKANNELRFKATNSTGASTPSAQHPGVKASLLNTTDWIHVMGVYDGVYGKSEIYFNGQLADRSAQSAGAPPLSGFVRAGQTAGIGAQVAAADPFAPTSLFKGAISDVAVWNRSLGAAEAQYLYNGGAGNAVGAANPNINPLPGITPVLPTAQPVIYYKFDGNLANSGTGGGSLDATVVGPNAATYASATFGNGLDLTSNPINGANGVDSKSGTGNYLSTNYKLPDDGTITTRFTAAAPLFNFVTLWSNSVGGNDWESWIYGDGRIAARADRATAIVGRNLFDMGDPSALNHVAFSWDRDGANVTVRLYINGEFVDERTGVWRDPGDNLFIGGGVSADNTSNTYATGVFDEFRVYSARLSDAEILYLSQNAPPTVAPTFAGDFNGDGSVNAADLPLWKTGFGKATGAVRGDGDADGNGKVDGADFLIWQRQFGSGSATPSAGAVPEPAAATLALVACSGALIASSRRRQ